MFRTARDVQGMRCIGLSIVSVLVMLSGLARASSISLAGEGFNPDPNEEVTVYVETDTPLLCLGALGVVSGDATITGAMNEDDSGDYGWDPGWTGYPYIDDVNGYVTVSGVCWAADANGVVGYFRFVYHSGQVIVSLSGEATDAAGQIVPFSAMTLVFGEEEPVTPDPNLHDPNSIPGEPGDPNEFWRYMYSLESYAPAEGEANPNAEGGTGTLPLVIDVDTTLKENTIWGQDVILEGTVFVEGCELVILPGVSVYNATGRGGIVVRNDGVLVAKGTNQSKVGFTSAASQPYQNDFPFAIKIEGTASPLCVISNCVVMFADKGIWVDDRRLEAPIEQLTIARCVTGIYEEGPELTDIVNNEMINCTWAGIDVYLTDVNDPNGTCSADTFIAIEHNSIIGWYIYGEWGQFFGIGVHGSPDPNRVGTVAIADNLIAGSYYYAMAMGDGWISCEGRYNNGYFNNWEIDTGDPWGDIDAVIANQCPFYYGYYTWPYLLKPGSPLVDAGVMTVEQAMYLIGQSTFLGFPDLGKADIGVHYNREGFVNAGVNPLGGDIDSDLMVDMKDVLLVTIHWLEDGNCPTYDPNMNLDNEDCINMCDLAIVAFDWRKVADPYPQDTPPAFDAEPNNLRGSVRVSANIPDFVRRSFLLLDGAIVAEFNGLAAEPNTVVLPTADYPNGIHSMKLLHITDSNSIFLTSPVSTTFNNIVYSMRASLAFHPSDANNRLLGGYYYGTGTLNVQVIDEVNDVVLWSASHTGNALDIVVPGAVFGESRICSLSVTEEPGGGGGGAPPASEQEISELLQRKFALIDWSRQPVHMTIIMPNPEIFKLRKPAIVECARACELNKVTWMVLFNHDVNEANLTYILGQRPDIKYVYWVGKGGSQAFWPVKGVDPVQRTYTECWLYKGRKWMETVESWEPRGVFSYTQQSTQGAYVLPNMWDTKGFDLTTLGMTESNSKKIVFVDACNSAAYDDMARAYGMFSLQGYSSNDQIYIGWKRQNEPLGESPAMLSASATEAVRMFWQQMGQGSDVYEALYYIYTDGAQEMKDLIWGPNGLVDLGSPSGDDGIGIYGQSGGLDNVLEK